MDIEKLKTGQQHMVQTRRGGFLPPFLWKNDKESKYLAVLTGIENVPKLEMHLLEAANGWRPFVCRKNEIFADESNGECPIDKMAEGKEDKEAKKFKSQTKYLALAVEVEPIEERRGGRREITGFQLVMDEYEGKDGETRMSPNFGLISQALSNFWTPYTVLISRKGDTTEYITEVVRSGGKGQKVSYNFFAYPGREEIDKALAKWVEESGQEIPSLLDWIADKGSKEHYDTELDGFDPNATPEESEAAAAESDDGTETDAATESETKSRFDALVQRMEAREKDSDSKSDD